jgi:hypothetical protein
LLPVDAINFFDLNWFSSSWSADVDFIFFTFLVCWCRLQFFFTFLVCWSRLQFFSRSWSAEVDFNFFIKVLVC